MKLIEIKELTDSLVNLQTIAKEDTSQHIANEIESIMKQLRLLYVEQAVADVISTCYDFGKVMSVTRLFGGLENQNFSVTTNNGQRHYRLFMRKYNKNARVKDILLEHKFNSYLCAGNFSGAAKCIQSKNGKTLVEHLVRYSHIKYADLPDEQSRFAVYSYLEGENRYSWMTPNCTMTDLASAGSMLARMHECGFGFDDGEYVKQKPKIIELSGKFPMYFSKYEKKAQSAVNGSKCFKYFLEKLPSYHTALEHCQLQKDKYKGMLELMIHGDYHPGNLKYSDDGVIGVFDFDWCRKDLRLFDAAIAVTYFCTSWKEHENGILFSDEIKVFLEAYQERLKDSPRIFPLTKEELLLLPEMIILANMYVIWWDLREIFELEDPESFEDDCLVYLVHNTKINNYALEHIEEIREITRKIGF